MTSTAAGERCIVLTLLAVQPQPRRGAVQIAERGGRASLHGRYSTPAMRAKSSRYPWRAALQHRGDTVWAKKRGGHCDHPLACSEQYSRFAACV